ncbi:hypothetical protein [Hoeflea sp.]|uniref:hypothetical protein n=1 Tax=Hoeflea sp. TaxID=1940281 RepID=UPI003747C145
MIGLVLGLIVLPCAALFPAYADSFFPVFYLSEDKPSRVHRNFTQPHLRARGLAPRIYAETTEIELEVGETVLVPVFSLIEDGLPMPILWTLENNIASIAGATIDKSRPYATNGVTLSAFGFRGLLPSGIAGPAATSPVQAGLGCERRFFLGNSPRFYDGHYRSQLGQPRAHHSAFLCIHGRDVGAGEIFIGEAFAEQDFNRRVDGSISLLRPPHLSRLARTAIRVKVVEAGAGRLKSEMAMAETIVDECNVDKCRLRAIPLNRGGERLSCQKPEFEVVWQYSSAIYNVTGQTDCSIELRPKFLPTPSQPAFAQVFQVNAIVSQIEDRQIPGGSRRVKTIKQSFSGAFLHPLANQETEPVKWARAICPAVVVPGKTFSCVVSVVSDTGNPPGPYAIQPNGWLLPPGLSFTGFSTSNRNYACFSLDANIQDGTLDRLSGRLDSGLVFSSARIAVSGAFGAYLTDAKPLDCP